MEPTKSNSDTTTTTKTVVGRGGAGNIFAGNPSPKLTPVSSAPHVPRDQKKFSISIGGYGNIKENQHSGDSDDFEALNQAKTNELAPELAPIGSVKSIGRGGFGNQVSKLKSIESEQGQHKTGGIMGKIKKIFK